MRDASASACDASSHIDANTIPAQSPLAGGSDGVDDDRSHAPQGLHDVFRQPSSSKRKRTITSSTLPSSSSIRRTALLQSLFWLGLALTHHRICVNAQQHPQQKAATPMQSRAVAGSRALELEPPVDDGAATALINHDDDDDPSKHDDDGDDDVVESDVPRRMATNMHADHNDGTLLLQASDPVSEYEHYGELNAQSVSSGWEDVASVPEGIRDDDDEIDADIEDDCNDNSDDANNDCGADGIDDDVIVVVAVDGTVAGLSKTTGELLWSRNGKLTKQLPVGSAGSATASATTRQRVKGFHAAAQRTRPHSKPTDGQQAGRILADHHKDERGDKDGHKDIESESPIMDPLLSTTTTTKSWSNQMQTSAVPSIDGSVYVTAAGVTVYTDTKKLVERAPFADKRGNFYIGSKDSSAAAIDGDTGELLHVVSSRGDRPPSIPKGSWEGRNVVWIGRVDHTIIIQEAQSAKTDASFSVAEIMSVSDMVVDTGTEAWKPTNWRGGSNASRRRRRRQGGPDAPDTLTVDQRDSDGLERQRQQQQRDRQLGLPMGGSSRGANLGGNDESKAGTDITDGSMDSHGRDNPQQQQHENAEEEEDQQRSSLISTPNGNLGFRNIRSGEVDWVTCEAFATPVVFAIDSATGSPIDVDMVQDVPIQNSSPDYMANQLGLQWESANIRDNSEEHTIVAAMKNGQLFALPLGKAQQPIRQSLAAPSVPQFETAKPHEQQQQQQQQQQQHYHHHQHQKMLTDGRAPPPKTPNEETSAVAQRNEALPKHGRKSDVNVYHGTDRSKDDIWPHGHAKNGNNGISRSNNAGKGTGATASAAASATAGVGTNANANANTNINANTQHVMTKIHHLGSRHTGRALPDMRHHGAASSDRTNGNKNRACHSGSSNFPACLVGTEHGYEVFARDPEGTFLSETAPGTPSALVLADPNSQGALIHYEPTAENKIISHDSQVTDRSFNQNRHSNGHSFNQNGYDQQHGYRPYPQQQQSHPHLQQNNQNHQYHHQAQQQYHPPQHLHQHGHGNGLGHGQHPWQYQQQQHHHQQQQIYQQQQYQSHQLQRDSHTHLDQEQYQHQVFGKADKRSSYQRFEKLMGHWIAPTIVIIFVMSFELGRRRRQKEMDNEKKLDLKSAELQQLDGKWSRSIDVQHEQQQQQEQQHQHRGLQQPQQQQHFIQVSDEVLGFGGQGTVVYKGMLEGRNVAVKRMLKAYTASADREISLLIESDGHPNVVRYFLKEVRGDFVYLALELCNMSLHELIGTLRSTQQQQQQQQQQQLAQSNLSSAPTIIHPAVKRVLQQIANGVKHIHSLRIVHRDLKPANILLALSGQKAASTTQGGKGQDADQELAGGGPANSTVDDERAKICNAFTELKYVAKISDMGLGKQLVGQSSFGVSTMADSSLRGQPKGGASLVGIGPGSVGWQAPEVMAQRWTSDCSMKSESNNNNNNNTTSNSNSKNTAISNTGDGKIGSNVARRPNNDRSSGSLVEVSPMEFAASSRTSRSVDIFSLGCIFHSTLIPGCHPFGEWFEREANIMHNRPDTEALSQTSVDAHDLVKSMIARNPKLRPSAQQICEHPFFWSVIKRLAFLCDLSDRVEADITMGKVASPKSSPAFVDNPLVLERGAVDVVGTAWDAVLDQALITNVQRFRTYDPSSVRDLLRLIRNKHHHFDELPSEFRDQLQESDGGLLGYFEALFPKLFMHCYGICRQLLTLDDPLAAKYAVIIPRRSKSRRAGRIAKGSDVQRRDQRRQQRPRAQSRELSPSMPPRVLKVARSNGAADGSTHDAITDAETSLKVSNHSSIVVIPAQNPVGGNSVDSGDSVVAALSNTEEESLAGDAEDRLAILSQSNYSSDPETDIETNADLDIGLDGEVCVDVGIDFDTSTDADEDAGIGVGVDLDCIADALNADTDHLIENIGTGNGNTDDGDNNNMYALIDEECQTKNMEPEVPLQDAGGGSDTDVDVAAVALEKKLFEHHVQQHHPRPLALSQSQNESHGSAHHDNNDHDEDRGGIGIGNDDDRIDDDIDDADDIRPGPAALADVGDIIIWEGSTAAKTYNCRGWIRSDEEWSRRADQTPRKRDPTLVRCADDPKFRTRLCNHWDVSLGTFCPMRRKNKCVFAHGPVELRVKEPKRGRWGKLVDKNGNNSNPWHSGGEDTYGAARSIEAMRKEEGKWNTGKKGGSSSGGNVGRGKKSNQKNSRKGGNNNPNGAGGKGGSSGSAKKSQTPAAPKNERRRAAQAPAKSD